MAGSSLDREVEADAAAALEGFPWVQGVYALALGRNARAHPDALKLAVVLSPYGLNELVQTHYALLIATGSRDVTGRVLYLNAAMNAPTPMAHAQRIVLDPVEREAARARGEERRKDAQLEELEATRLSELRRAFAQLAEASARDRRRGVPARRTPAPYRGTFAKTPGECDQSELQDFVNRVFDDPVLASLQEGGVLEIASDPFPADRRKRLLVADDDPSTADAIANLGDYDITHARDGWTAVDLMTENDFDLVLLAVVVGGISGARLYRMVTKARPAMAARVVFVASVEAVVGTEVPPSAAGRVLTRPIRASDVRALLGERDDLRGIRPDP